LQVFAFAKHSRASANGHAETLHARQKCVPKKESFARTESLQIIPYRYLFAHSTQESELGVAGYLHTHVYVGAKIFSKSQQTRASVVRTWLGLLTNRSLDICFIVSLGEEKFSDDRVKLRD
jgi:hypothetical protein